ncbi:Phosphatidylinositol N-acetyglucosaminlytransferase subunit P-related [Melia azedarach]|uniref:Phosphatidylinositol N-acetyglucosaminlytransferase subunit P-related n=1 Tax=Melia azedarach TaxID=155640 RepID=A0ACC1X260_MELAZ|nr:Phosphatidylinositol N-acetyglucosaminlytransferase subunit P-related [Melia azedarach]
METFQRRRSKITSFTADLLGSAQPAFLEGNRQAQKQRNFPKLASDSSSCGSETTEDESLMFELGWRSSRKPVRTPMKKLLAEEMSRETESKRRSPSVIARLMGLDGLPASQSTHKQHKKSAENYQHRSASVDRAQRSVTSSGRRSFRKSSKEEQEFKDVFEVLDASKMETGSNQLQESTNSKLTEAEMVFIRQKFMDAKRLSTDERFQDSKEFHDALEVLDSNKDLLLKFLQQPDSLFTKHLHDLGSSPQSHCGHISAIAPSNARNHEISDLCWKAEGETQWKKHCKSSQKHLDSPTINSCTGHAAQSLNQPPIIHLEGKEDPSIIPTRIVVLKPNLGKVQAASTTVSSPCSCHASDCRKHMELPGIQNRETETWEKKNIPADVGISRHKSRESREIAKEITRQMKNSLSSGPMKFSNSGFKGYAGDDSSSNLSGNESVNELEVKSMSSKDHFVRHRRSRSSSSRSSESSVSREAKRRLSERWKMSHKSQELGVTNRGSTLGEMLAISDREVKPANLDAMIGREGFGDKFDGNDGPAGWVEPLGISSRDGWKDAWKDGCTTGLTRSRSLPASSTLGSPKTSMRYETLRDDRYVIPKETLKREKTKGVKGNFNHRESSSSRNSRSGRRKYLSSQCTDSSPNIITETNSVPENLFDVGLDNTTTPSALPNPEFSAPLLPNGELSTGDSDNLILKEPSDGPSKEVPLHQPVSELESPASSKDVEQPSPVSILEAPFVDDLSCGSEYFESVSADLHGLRMQLQLLKSESEAYTEGTMLVSSDEDVEERSVGFIDEKSVLKIEDNWEYCYVADILIDSGFNDVDPDTFITSCYSLECPVNPSVFEELEKKYCNLTSLSRSQRKLMFDCINAKLLEIQQQFVDQHPWVKPGIRIRSKWNKNGLQESLVQMSQQKKVTKDAGEKVLGRESEWLEIGEDIDIIGKEIETLLIDELVAEVVAM